jgi:hypothetical protein
MKQVMVGANAMLHGEEDSFETLSWLEKFSMIAPSNRTWVSDSSRRMVALTALIATILLLAVFCHYPEATGPTVGHTHLGQASVEHCWTSLPSSPPVAFVPRLVAILTFVSMLHERLLVVSLFKPPRAFLRTRRWSVHR